ncbi:MAG: glutamate formimidoyltransferase [Caldilineaceae bacterium]|nr:glutamate formimidoyltransferase [Caldilineaceae bacterium]
MSNPTNLNTECSITESATIVESVPNFSEGRRPEVVQAIVTAIQTPGVLLLNYSSDWDHNRTVVTIAGPPEAVLEGLFQAIRVAATLIDLREQQGAHPRVGATDVVPIVPLQNCTLAQCAALAGQLGARIGKELQLPVYLYEAAATRPERRLLADVRRGEYERLQQEIDQPHRQPDFGPTRVGPAGAVIVGARTFLIAYNIYLESTDVTLAQTISRRIRERNGGFTAVRAIGLFVHGQAQVSINLVDYRQTSLYQLFTEVVRLAEVYGTRVTHSELIGLVPQDAILAVAAEALKLNPLTADQLIEHAFTRAQQHSHNASHKA